jgi:hypothetical protein
MVRYDFNGQTRLFAKRMAVERDNLVNNAKGALS